MRQFAKKVWKFMFSKPRKLQEKGKRVFITYEDTTWLWLSFDFASWILDEFFNTFTTID